jgi:hypothetical protein
MKVDPKLPPPRLSRMAVMLEQDKDIDLPDIDEALCFIIVDLFEAGPISVAGSSQIPLTWSDLQTWERGVGVELPLWQARLIRHLSAMYLSEYIRSDAHDAPPPWEKKFDRDRVAKHVRKLLRAE